MNIILFIFIITTIIILFLLGLKRLKNCAKLPKSGEINSGVYAIKPDGAGPVFEVFCDHKTGGGGWTVVQKRLDGSVDFDRNWSDYKNGFGNLDGEFGSDWKKYTAWQNPRASFESIWKILTAKLLTPSTTCL